MTHDFKAALDTIRHERWIDYEVKYNTYLGADLDTIEYALRLAEAVTGGPTRLMVVEGLTEFMPYGTPHEVVTAIFKAMIKTIQKEIGDE